MLQIIEQTHEETVAMYMKCTKAQLAEMLANCNELLAAKPINIFNADQGSESCTIQEIT